MKGSRTSMGSSGHQAEEGPAIPSVSSSASSECYTYKVDEADGNEFEFGVDYGPRRSGVFGTFFNTANTIVGAGILGMPAVVKSCGYVSGILLLFLVCVMTQLSSVLIFKTCDKLGGNRLSFNRVVEVMNTTWLPTLMAALVAVLCITVCSLFLSLTADFLPPVMKFFDGNETAWYFSRWFCVLLPFLCIILPLSLSNMFSVLQYTSFLAMGMAIYTFVVVLRYAFLPLEDRCAGFLIENPGSQCFDDNCCIPSTLSGGIEKCCIGSFVPFTDVTSGYLSSLPTLVSAYGCSPQLFVMYNDLVNPTSARFVVATDLAIFFAFLLYIGVAIGGYYAFGDKVASNVIESFPINLELTVVRLGIAFITMTSYPLLFIPARDSVMEGIAKIIEMVNGFDILMQRGSPASLTTFWLSTIFVFGFSIFVALLEVPLTTFLNVAGTVSVLNLSYTMPGLFYLFIITEEKSRVWTAVSILSIVFGVGACLANIVVWIVDGI